MSKVTKFKNKTKPKKTQELKAHLGFEYIKLKKDVNGLDFNMAHLKEYSIGTKYIISVARELEKGTFVYNFFVSNENIDNFFTAYLDGKIEGKIIEIDKQKPEILA